jgi:hypothetical protein
MSVLVLLLALQAAGRAGETGGSGERTGILLPLTGSPPLTRSPYVQEDPPPTPLQKALNDLEARGDWRYNDLSAGFAAAKKAGKPLCVVIRCPP